MAHILTLGGINDVLANVFRMVANTLQRFGNPQHFEGQRNQPRVFKHERDQTAHDKTERFINGLIIPGQLYSIGNVQPGISVQRFAQHIPGIHRHGADFRKLGPCQAVAF